MWVCSTYNLLGKDVCPSKQIPEETLYTLLAEILKIDVFDIKFFNEKISDVRALPNNTIVFNLRDGNEIVKQWKDRSRAESWTEEMKEKARQQRRNR